MILLASHLYGSDLAEVVIGKTSCMSHPAVVGSHLAVVVSNPAVVGMDFWSWVR